VANENAVVDVAGAKELARVLAERQAGRPPVEPVPPVADPDAAPIFRWVGVEPPSATTPANDDE